MFIRTSEKAVRKSQGTTGWSAFTSLPVRAGNYGNYFQVLEGHKSDGKVNMDSSKGSHT